jgi:hypothetical protein
MKRYSASVSHGEVEHEEDDAGMWVFSDDAKQAIWDAVAAERERCANLCLSRSANGNYRADTREDCAALILGEFD